MRSYLQYYANAEQYLQGYARLFSSEPNKASATMIQQQLRTRLAQLEREEHKAAARENKELQNELHKLEQDQKASELNEVAILDQRLAEVKHLHRYH